MKKVFVIFGIVLMIIGVLGLLLGFLFLYSSTHTQDGPSGLYAKQRMMGFLFITGGVVCMVVSVLCFLLRKKY